MYNEIHKTRGEVLKHWKNNISKTVVGSDLLNLIVLQNEKQTFFFLRIAYKNSNFKMILLFGSLAKQFNILLHAFYVLSTVFIQISFSIQNNIAFINNLSELMLKSCVICYILLYVFF